MMEVLGKGDLYIVATPIGNLEDVTLRALRILQAADVIVCEDTRVTQKLLKHYDINEKQLFSWHANSSEHDLQRIMDWLKEGKNVAYASDAGTPGISDPGVLLVSKVYETLPDVKVVAIPGPSALTALASIAGVPLSQFVWLGFLPHKKGRESLFKEIAASDRPVIFFESPHRIKKTLKSLSEFAPDKQVIIGRELTKVHEEVIRGLAGWLLEKAERDELLLKGEMTVIVTT